MADRIVESSDTDVPEIPVVLENAMLYALGEAQKKMENGEEVIPFTCLVVKNNIFIETHPGNTADECFNSARRCVQHARGAAAYVLCYDGYIEIDDGVQDSLIAEGGIPGEDDGYACGTLYYPQEDGSIRFEEEVAYIGQAPNFMFALKAPGEYDDDEIDEMYLDDEEEDEEEAEEALEDEDDLEEDELDDEDEEDDLEEEEDLGDGDEDEDDDDED